MALHRITRRSALQAAGISIALPWFETTQRVHSAEPSKGRNRMVCVYVPNGVNYAKWLPQNTGLDYHLSPTLQTLQEFRSDFSVLSGLLHPNSQGGHSGADTWLTSADLKATAGYDYRNAISVDQLAAQHFSPQTRIASLQLSAHGGTGKPGHSQTLSFNDQGTPLPAERDPKQLFHRLFTNDGLKSKATRSRRIQDDQSVLDVVLDQAKALRKNLSNHDQRKLDEYLHSVREVESRLAQQAAWIDKAKPKLDPNLLPLQLQPNDEQGSENYYRLMFDLIFLALSTDSTRVCSFQLAREAHGGFVQGIVSNGNHHELSHHGGDAEMLEGLFLIDQFYLKLLGHFLTRLKSAQEGRDTLLDRTMVFYGSGMNSGKGGGHSAKELPLLVAGGKALGLKQGQHLAFDGKTPLSNLFVTMLQQSGIRTDQFGDSVGTLTGLT